MKNKFKGLFSYLKNKEDYPESANALKKICRKYLGQLENYEQEENAIIDLLIPTIHYFKNESLASNISTTLSVVNTELKLNYRDEQFKIQITALANEIVAIRENYSFLKYFNNEEFEPINLRNYSDLVYTFLKDTDVWTIKTSEEDPDGYLWQVEWDIEYKQLLNRAYYATCEKEIYDLHNLIWLIWLHGLIKGNATDEAKIIWSNLNYWKEMVQTSINKSS